MTAMTSPIQDESGLETQLHWQKDFEHFLRIANRGRHPSASRGEKAANALLRTVKKQIGMLDDSAIAGLQKFCELYKYHPDLVDQLTR